MKKQSKGQKRAFLLISKFLDNLVHLFANGKIQIELYKENDQHHNLATSAYGYYDQLEAFSKKNPM